MRRVLVSLVLGLSLFSLPAFAKEAAGTGGGTTNMLEGSHSFGIGIGGGLFAEGISAKYFLAKNMSLQGVLGSWNGLYYGPRDVYGWYGYGLAANIDVLVEMPQIASNGTVGLNWNVGGGADVAFNTAQLGINGVLGLSLQIKPVPFEFAVDLRPTLFLNHVPGLWWGAGGSIRYFF